MRGHTVTLAALGAVAYMALDGIWLGLLMKNFYRDQLEPIVRLAGAAFGAVFGLVVYGVYDFTNYSTLRQWPFVLTRADVAWGTVASAAAAASVRTVAR